VADTREIRHAGASDAAEAIRVWCYADRRDGKWEGFCLNFDLAVQGDSLEDVRVKLNEQICLYLESVQDLPKEERSAFLNRRAPLTMRLRAAWTIFRALSSENGGRDFDSFKEHRHLAAA
jgi:hypothetical protein